MSKRQKYTQIDGTEKLFTTPRQEGTYLYFTGYGDDLTNQTRGNGQKLAVDYSGETGTEKTIEFGFMDDVYIKDGVLSWMGAVFGDEVSLEIYLPANTYYKTPHSNGNFDLVDGSYVANATWTGEYLALPMDYTLNRFVNGMQMCGDNHVGTWLESSDVDLISKELRFKGIVKSPSVNTNLKFQFCMEMYRSNTV